jgi:hypothetical protein
MQIVPSPTTVYWQTITPESGRADGAESAPMTPAERIALTIALLNRGLDLLDGLARTSLVRCTRAAFRGHHDAAWLPRPGHWHCAS